MLLRIMAFLLAIIVFPACGFTLNSAASSGSPRTIVFISDLHMGLGKDANDDWYPTEDFRWPGALEGFLNYISREGEKAVDLVIVGDFLELWQPPKGISCRGPNANYGCSLAEAASITEGVISAHSRELAALSSFSEDGNCIYVIPGNHDAALLIDSVWSLLADALKSDKGCVERVASGRWTSESGKVVAEHGHQIGWDANRYGEWPRIVAEIDGGFYLRRPWGEQFVQRIFNDAEADNPLIDNLSPLSAGVKYRAEDRGTQTVGDLARFLVFNLLETSVSQKVQILGETDQDQDTPPKWDVNFARRLGSKLFISAMAPDDAFAEALRAPGEFGEEMRRELDRLARDRKQTPDDAILSMCDQAAARGATKLCQRAQLGHIITKTVLSRKRVVGPYVEGLWKEKTDMRLFVYGHTHAFETEWRVAISSRVSVVVMNDGAFQRVIDDAKFRALARSRNLDPSEALTSNGLGLEALPACYTFVTVKELPSGALERDLSAWHMPEDGPGKPVGVCDALCADVGHGC